MGWRRERRREGCGLREILEDGLRGDYGGGGLREGERRYRGDR